MDIFMEKIVKRRKSAVDSIIIAGTIVIGLVLIMIVGSVSFLQTFMPVLLVAIGYLGYMLIRNRNVEYEYIVTNGDLDIDMIIAQRKRKRVFSGSCKDFEIVAKMTSGQYNQSYEGIKNRLSAVTSMESNEVYFISTVKDGEKMLVFFEPHPKMIESFKKYIPRKVFE